ncbi:hypothetical protein [Chroococcidiopsis sp. CCNUC1]
MVGKNSAAILSGALTLRVTAFVLMSPLAGAIAIAWIASALRSQLI